MKLEAGKQYVRRDGKVSGPLVRTSDPLYHFEDEDNDLSYTEIGFLWADRIERKADLLRLATPEEIAAGKALPEAVQLSPESVMELRGDIDAMHAEREAKDARIATLERDLASRQALLDIADKQVGRLAFDCAEAAERIKELEQNVKYAEGLASMVIDERDELRTQLAKERAESYEILQKILDEKVVVEDRLAEANAKYEQLDSEGAGMLQELRRVRAELEARTTELEGYLSERSSTVENQNAFIVDLMTERDALKTQVADLSQLYAEETQNRHKDYEALSRASKEIAELRAEVKRAVHAYDIDTEKLQKQLAEANATVAYKQRLVTRLYEAHRDRTTKIANLEQTVHEVTMQLAEANEALKYNREEVSRLYELSLDQRTTIAGLERDLAEANETIQRMGIEKINLHKLIDEANEKLAALKPAEPTIDEALGILMKRFGKVTIHTEIKPEHADLVAEGLRKAQPRRDHMPDGSVRCELEPSNQGETMTVIIRLQTASEPLYYHKVENTYTKGPLYCLRLDNGHTLKIPLVSIFTIEELPE